MIDFMVEVQVTADVLFGYPKSERLSVVQLESVANPDKMIK